MADIGVWLSSLGFGEYASVFESEGIDVEVLGSLTDSDLKELGVSRLGDRKRLLAAIAGLGEGGGAQGVGVDVGEWPSPLALPVWEYGEEGSPVLGLWHLCDAVELSLRFAVMVGLGELRREGAELPSAVLRVLAGRIEEPTLGKWRGMAEAVTGSVAGELAAVPEVVGLVSQVLVPLLDGVEAERTPASSLSALRNRLAHGGGLRKQAASELLSVWGLRFAAALEQMQWLSEVEVVVRGEDGALGVLRGPSGEVSPYSPVNATVSGLLESGFGRGDEVQLVRGESVLALWPLAAYGPARQGEETTPSSASVPQVYVRRGAVGLEYTALGSESVVQGAGDVAGLAAFVSLFRLEEHRAERQLRRYEVPGFEGELERDADRLVGRTEELDRLRSTVQGTSTGVLWLTGSAGVGKSYVVARLTQELLASTEDLVLAYRFRSGDERCSRTRFLEFAVERLAQWEGLAPEEEEEEGQRRTGPPPRPLDQLRVLLTRVQSGRVIFVLDGLDELAERDAAFAESVPLGLAYPGVVWLCAGRSERGLEAAFTAARCRWVYAEGLPPMGGGDIRTMLLEKIGPLRKRLLRQDREEDEGIANPFIETVASCAQGLPLYVTYVIGDVLGGRYRALDAGERLPPSLSAYHEELLRRCSVGSLQQVLTPLAATLAVAREPLSVSVLGALLARRTVVPEGVRGEELVREGLGAMSSMVRRQATPEGAEGYGLFHDSLRQHMLESAATRDAVQLARAAMAEASLAIGEGALASYLYRWGVSHLVGLGRRAEALGLLTDFGYLMRRLQRLPSRAAVQAVTTDWGLVESGELNEAEGIWREFWRVKEHLLLRGDEEWPPYKILLQLAWEHADTSPVTKAAEAWLEEGHCGWTWLRMKGAQRPEDAPRSPLLREHEVGEFSAAAVSLDGKSVLLAGGNDGHIRRVDLESGDVTASCSVGRAVECLAPAPDGTLLVGDQVGQLHLVGADLLPISAPWQACWGAVREVFKLGDSGRIATRGPSTRMRTYNLEGGQCVSDESVHFEAAGLVVCMPCGMRAVAAGEDGLVVASLATGSVIRPLGSTRGPWSSIAVSGDGSTVAAVHENDSSIWVFDVESGMATDTIETAWARVVALGRDATDLVWSDVMSEGRIQRNHPETYAKEALTPPQQYFAHTLVYAGGARLLVTIHGKDSLTVWDTDAWRVAWHAKATSAVACGSAGLALVGADGQLSLVDVHSWAVVGTTRPTRSRPVALLGAALDGRFVVYLDEQSDACVWETKKGPTWPVARLSPHEKAVVADDGTLHVLGSSMDGRIWSGHGGTCLYSLPDVDGMAGSADGAAVVMWRDQEITTIRVAGIEQPDVFMAHGMVHKVAVGTGDPAGRVYCLVRPPGDMRREELREALASDGEAGPAIDSDVLDDDALDVLMEAEESGLHNNLALEACSRSTGERLAELEMAYDLVGEATGLWAVPGTAQVAAASDHGVVTLHDSSLRLLGSWRAHRGSVAALQCDLRTETMVTVGHDGRMRLWDLSMAEAAKTGSSGLRDFSAMAVAAHGGVAVAGSPDGMLQAMDLHSGIAMWSVTTEVGKIGSLAFLPDGSSVLVGGDGGPVQQYALETGAEIGRLATDDHSRDADISIDVSRDGHRALISGMNGGISRWDIGPEGPAQQGEWIEMGKPLFGARVETDDYGGAFALWRSGELWKGDMWGGEWQVVAKLSEGDAAMNAAAFGVTGDQEALVVVGGQKVWVFSARTGDLFVGYPWPWPTRFAGPDTLRSRFGAGRWEMDFCSWGPELVYAQVDDEDAAWCPEVLVADGLRYGVPVVVEGTGIGDCRLRVLEAGRGSHVTDADAAEERWGKPSCSADLARGLAADIRSVPAGRITRAGRLQTWVEAARLVAGFLERLGLSEEADALYTYAASEAIGRIQRWDIYDAGAVCSLLLSGSRTHGNFVAEASGPESESIAASTLTVARAIAAEAVPCPVQALHDAGHALLVLAETAEEAGDLSGAREFVEEAGPLADAYMRHAEGELAERARLRVGVLRHSAGVLGAMGDERRRTEAQEAAVVLCEEILEEAWDTGTADQLGALLVELGDQADNAGDRGKAVERYRRSVELGEGVLATEPERHEYLEYLATRCDRLARCLGHDGDLEGALTNTTKAIACREELGRLVGDSSGNHLTLSLLYDELAQIKDGQRDGAGCLHAFEAALEHVDRAMALDAYLARDTDLIRHRAWVTAAIGRQQLRDPATRAEGLVRLRQAVGAVLGTAGSEPDDEALAMALWAPVEWWCMGLAASGRAIEAFPLLRAALRNNRGLIAKLAQEAPSWVVCDTLVAGAEAAKVSGDTEGANEALRSFLELVEAARGCLPPDSESRVNFGERLYGLGQLWASAGDETVGGRLCELATEVLSEAGRTDDVPYTLGEALVHVAPLWRDQGEHHRWRTCIGTALGLRDWASELESSRAAYIAWACTTELGCIRLVEGDTRGAIELLERSHEIVLQATELHGDSVPRRQWAATTATRLGVALLRRGDVVAAEPRLREAVALCEELADFVYNADMHVEAVEHLAEALGQLNRDEERDQALRQAEDLRAGQDE